MIERDEKGRFVSQGPDDGFDGEEAKETAGEHSWQNHRKQNLKRLGLWDKINE